MAQKLFVVVGAKAKVFEEFEIPANRFDGKKLDHFLQAIFCRYRTKNAQEMIPYYVNRRGGEPKRETEQKVVEYFHYERRRCGRFCGNWEMYALAFYNIDQIQADGIKNILNQNRRSSS